MVCKECKQIFKSKKLSQQFCKSKCRMNYWNKKRGPDLRKKEMRETLNDLHRK